jgi:hypothetical protein
MKLPHISPHWTRRRLGCVLAAAVVAVGVSATIALATGSRSGAGYTRVGPFSSPNAIDVTTCGNIWARGPAAQVYKVFPRRPDGTYLVLAQFVGRLTSVAGTSIGACNNGAPNNGATIGAGVNVVTTQNMVWVIRDGTFNPAATCQAASSLCFINGFTRSFFGSSASFESVSEIGLYESRCNGSWLGSGPGLNGQQAGDITGAKTPGCPD